MNSLQIKSDHVKKYTMEGSIMPLIDGLTINESIKEAYKKYAMAIVKEFKKQPVTVMKGKRGKRGEMGMVVTFIDFAQILTENDLEVNCANK